MTVRVGGKGEEGGARRRRCVAPLRDVVVGGGGGRERAGVASASAAKRTGGQPLGRVEELYGRDWVEYGVEGQGRHPMIVKGGVTGSCSVEANGAFYRCVQSGMLLPRKTPPAIGRGEALSLLLACQP